MTKQELLDLLKTLSAVESWSFANNNRMPDYLLDRVDGAIETLEREILK